MQQETLQIKEARALVVNHIGQAFAKEDNRISTDTKTNSTKSFKLIELSQTTTKYNLPNMLFGTFYGTLVKMVNYLYTKGLDKIDT